jgi:hypothetical protein
MKDTETNGYARAIGDRVYDMWLVHRCKIVGSGFCGLDVANTVLKLLVVSFGYELWFISMYLISQRDNESLLSKKEGEERTARRPALQFKW